MTILWIILKTIAKVAAGYLFINYVLRTISYSFYKGNQHKENIRVKPTKLTYANELTGYGNNLNHESESVILCFGGSFYIAYNTVGMFADDYEVPFFALDYYGTQDSPGKMNLTSMKKSAETLFDWVKERYPERKIIVIGHSYGCGIAAYLASVRPCDYLFLLSAFRNLADLYNRIIPIFWGPLKRFITGNLEINKYAAQTTCPVMIIGSDADKTLKSNLQIKLAGYYENVQVKIFPDIQHENYLSDTRVISLIQKALYD